MDVKDKDGPGLNYYQYISFIKKTAEVLEGCWDLDLEGSNTGFMQDTSSYYRDHFSQIILKSNHKWQRYRANSKSGLGVWRRVWVTDSCI